MFRKLIAIIALLSTIGAFAQTENAKVYHIEPASMEFQEQDGYFGITYEFEESESISDDSDSSARIVYDIPEIREMLEECVAGIESPEDEMVKLLLALKTEQSLRWQLEKPETTEELSYVFTPTEEPSALTVEKMIEYASRLSDEFILQQCNEPDIENAWDLRFAEHIAVRLFADGADKTATVERVALIADYLTEYGEEYNDSNGGN